MHCTDVLEFSSDYIAGQMDRALAVSLENHLASCSECRERIEGLRHVWTTLDQMPTVDPPPFFHENLMSRITAEQTQAEEEAARKRALWDWRALFRPRALAMAASVVALLFIGMEGLHSQGAALDPIGALLHLLHRTPAPVYELQASRAEWMANANGGGVLTLHLQARANTLTIRSVQCKVARPDGHEVTVPEADPTVTSDKETTLTVLLDAPPTGSTVTVKVSPAEGPATGEKTMSVPLMIPQNVPDAPAQ